MTFVFTKVNAIDGTDERFQAAFKSGSRKRRDARIFFPTKSPSILEGDGDLGGWHVVELATRFKCRGTASRCELRAGDWHHRRRWAWLR
jgi:hypothetical protein